MLNGTEPKDAVSVFTQNSTVKGGFKFCTPSVHGTDTFPDEPFNHTAVSEEPAKAPVTEWLTFAVL